MNQLHKPFRWAWSILIVCSLAFAMGGCEGDDGSAGATGSTGSTGATGADGADGADGPVSPGWNTQYLSTDGGRFSLSATPSPGSLNVYDYETGRLLDYPDEYVESDDGGMGFTISASATLIMAIYYVPNPALGQHIPISRPSEMAEGQNMERGPRTGPL